ncbi:uncharacterized protein LOC143240080 [Tachypleus tridentatus]|uniref:uncharacterized protein LOC143237350 n=1 Tax=Tachypleus tridentatus TaxID=6853 RepID=UPI003FD55983
MAPKGFWRRPLTQMYNRNYQYGTGLYSGALEDIEKRYSDSMSRTRFAADRLDTGLNVPTETLARSRSPRAEINAATTSRPQSFHDTTSAPDTYDIRKSRTFDDFDSFRKRVLEEENPSSHVYFPHRSTYYGTYNIEEDAETRGRGQRKHQEFSDLNPHEPLSNPTTNSAQWMDRCRELQKQIEQLTQRVSDAETNVKTEVKEMKNKMQMEIVEVGRLLEETLKQNEEQQKVIKKQATRLAELESRYNEVQRHLEETNELLASSQLRCKTLHEEVTNLNRVMDYC